MSNAFVQRASRYRTIAKNSKTKPGPALRTLRREFDRVTALPNPEKRKLLDKIVHHWFASFSPSVCSNFSPVLVMRGGLLFYEQALRYFTQPIGLLLPPRPRDTGGSLDIPNLSKAHGYMLLDLIANTGTTTDLALDLMKIHSSGVKLIYAVMFATEESLNTVRQLHPDVSVIAAFDDFTRGPSGWLNGIDFDAGDLATNNPKSITRFHM